MTSLPFLLLTGAFGAMALAVQVLILRRLLAVFYGSEIIIAMVMAGWLAGVFLGARFMGLLHPERRNMRLFLWAWPIAWIAVIYTSLTYSFLLPGMTGLSPGETASIEIIVKWILILTCPPSLFVGALFVLAGSYYDELKSEEETDRRAVGSIIFYVESVGSCAGLLAFTYIFAGRAGPFQTITFYAAIILILQCLTLIESASKRLFASISLTAFLVLINLTGLMSMVDFHAAQAGFKRSHPAYRFKDYRESPYQHLSLAEREGENSLFGNQIFINSWPDPYHYQRTALFFLTEAYEYDRVLLAGQGPGGYIHELLDQNVKRLTYIALDPAETELTRKHLGKKLVEDLKDPRLTIIHDDVRRFLQESSLDPFDLIIINTADPDNARINRTFTLEFFEEARKRLSSNGILITSISGSDNYWSREMQSYGSSLYATMEKVFPEIVITPGDVHYFIAGVKPGLVTNDPEELARRYKNRGFSSIYLTPRALTGFFPPTGSRYIDQMLSESQNNEEVINTDARPLTYLLRLAWWEKMTGDRGAQRVLRVLMNIRSWGIWAAAALLLPILVLIIKPKPQAAAVWTIGTTGAVTMALQIILMFIFQNKYGILYQQVGLISAIFMAGLAAGSFLGGFLVRRIDSAGRAAPALEVSLAAIAGLTAMTAWNHIPDITLYLVGFTGAVSGLEFAVLYAMSIPENSPEGVTKALTRLEAADHGGAVFGAALTGVILAPIIGLGLTAAILAGYKLVNGMLMMRTAFDE